jgi:hypothetical protein
MHLATCGKMEHWVGTTTDGNWLWEGGQPVVTGALLSKTY